VKSEENTERLAAAGTAAPNTAAPESARLIVCERTGRWATVLRRELAESGIRVWETRTLDDCWTELALSPASFLVLELVGDAGALWHRAVRQARDFPMARLAVVADRGLADYAGLMYEAGAVCFLASPRKVGRLAQSACRHLAQAPLPQQSFSERIWASLPWA
jgi:hypothetical protein